MEAATMVFKVEAKTAIDESRSWVRIARNRLLALANASDDPAALKAAADQLDEMFAAFGDIECRLRAVDDEWMKLLQPRPARATAVAGRVELPATTI
jgi:hypothetical protein